MKLSKNGRKTQKAIRRALMLGLPVAGLLLTAGCDRSTPKTKEPNAKELKEETVDRDRLTTKEPCTIGVAGEKIGGDFSTK